MNADRFASVTGRYADLRIGVVGDFFLDRYLEIDPAKEETSIETGLPVHNVVSVRAQPGAAGTIVNNLVALGVGMVAIVGFCGDDGEGYELRRELSARRGVRLEHFIISPERRTPVYCKPLVMAHGHLPQELNRLDSKNWTPTPEDLQHDLAQRVSQVAAEMDALLLMDQVDLPETGVVTRTVAEAAHAASLRYRSLIVLADSRRGVQDYPPIGYKMNAAELGRIAAAACEESDEIAGLASALAGRTGHPVFVTLSERGIIGAQRGRPPEHVPAFPVRGPVDIVGAGDAVTANIAAALAAGAELREAMELAMAAASIVIHQLGTTGTASVGQIADLIK
jgi:rfaE bifunctional protein kinase chain/domain